MAVVVNSYPVGTDLVSFSDQHLSGVSGGEFYATAVVLCLPYVRTHFQLPSPFLAPRARQS